MEVAHAHWTTDPVTPCTRLRSRCPSRARRRLATRARRSERSLASVAVDDQILPLKAHRLALFLAPALALLVVFRLIPIEQAFYLSFTRWTGGSVEPAWIGLENFARILTDPVFWAALQNNLLVLLSLPVWVVAPLLIVAIDPRRRARRKILPPDGVPAGRAVAGGDRRLLQRAAQVQRRPQHLPPRHRPRRARAANGSTIPTTALLDHGARSSSGRPSASAR